MRIVIAGSVVAGTSVRVSLGIAPACAPAFFAAPLVGAAIGAAQTELLLPRPGRVPEPLDLPGPIHIPTPQEDQ